MKKCKKAMALLLALTLLLALAACGSKAPAATLEDFVGFWVYENMDVFLTVYDDGSWYYDWQEEDMENHEGSAKLRDGKLELLDSSGVYRILTLRDANTLVDEDDDVLLRTDPSDAPEAVPNTVVEDFYGTWKYDDYDQVIQICEDGTWEMYSADGGFAGSAQYSFENEMVTLLDGNGDAASSLSINGEQLIDNDGDALSRYALPEAPQHIYPSAEDPLTELGALPDYTPTASFLYPSSLEYEVDAAGTRRVHIEAADSDVCQEEPAYGTLMLTEIINFDQNFAEGAAKAEKTMQYLLAKFASDMFPELSSFAAQQFVDNGDYYSLNAFFLLPETYIYDFTAEKPLVGVIEARYCGPTGYMLVSTAVAEQEHIGDYAVLMQNIMDSTEFGGGWSTAVKPVPQKPAGVGTGSDSGDYGTPYTWYDSDGDVWYWNGYEDIFIGYGDDYYIDDDGNYYESNDAGWDYDDYDSYYDDYDPWSDPGDGADAWSDPGDYYDGYDPWSDSGDTDYYEDDGEYYESQDADW